MNYGYIRAKTPEEYDDMAKALAAEHAIAAFFSDGESQEEFPAGLTELLETLEPRDVIITQSCTALSTDEVTLQKIIAKIRKKKCAVRFLDLTNHGMENPALRALKAKQTQRWC